MYDDVTAIYDLSGGPRVIPSYKPSLLRKDQAPKLIPQIIHQTYKSSQVPNNVRPMMHSWRHMNPNWEIRFYDDEACRDFVAKEFPEYVQAYRLVLHETAQAVAAALSSMLSQRSQVAQSTGRY